MLVVVTSQCYSSNRFQCIFFLQSPFSLFALLLWPPCYLFLYYMNCILKLCIPSSECSPFQWLCLQPPYTSAATSVMAATVIHINIRYFYFCAKTWSWDKIWRFERFPCMERELSAEHLRCLAISPFFQDPQMLFVARTGKGPLAKSIGSHFIFF